MNILVKFEHFTQYQKDFNTFYLDKKNGYYIHHPSKTRILNNFKPVLEMFDGIDTDYIFSKESNDNNMCVVFNTNSNTKYRLDLIKEPNTKIYHLAFSLEDVELDKYENLTKLNESKEVFSRIAYILKDLTKKFNIYEFCIGATGLDKKDFLYSKMMRYVESWEKRDTVEYELGWALYFKI
jgi:hypothetical protein